MNTFGDRLRQARIDKGLTQKQLADMIGAKHNSISNWENNQNKPDPDTIEIICGVLDIEPNYLLSKETKTDLTKKEFSNYENSLLSEFNKLNEIGKIEAVNRVSELTYIPQYKATNTIFNNKKTGKYIPTEEDIKSLVARNGKKLTREEAIDLISSLFSEDEEE